MPNNPVESTRQPIVAIGLTSIKQRLSYIDVMHGFSENILSINFTMRMKAIQREAQTIQNNIAELDKGIEDVERDVRSDRAPHFHQAPVLSENIIKIIKLLQAMFEESNTLNANSQIHPSSNCFRMLMTWLLANDTRDLASRMKNIHIICKRHVHLEMEDIISSADPALSHNDILRLIKLTAINGQLVTRNAALKANAHVINSKSCVMRQYSDDIDAISQICTDITLLMDAQEQVLQNISFDSKQVTKQLPPIELKSIQMHDDESWTPREQVLLYALLSLTVLFCLVVVKLAFPGN